MLRRTLGSRSSTAESMQVYNLVLMRVFRSEFESPPERLSSFGGVVPIVCHVSDVLVLIARPILTLRRNY